MPFKHQRLKNARPRIQMLVMFFYTWSLLADLLTFIIVLSNTDYYRGQPRVLKVFMVFIIVGFVVFPLVCSPLFYWSYAYADELSPSTRAYLTKIPIVIHFTCYLLPMTWIHIYIVSSYGILQFVAGVAFVDDVIGFAIGFFVTWHTYTWKASKVLQIHYGAAAPSENTVAASVVAAARKGRRI